jgi:hypothetical protein
MQVTEVKKRLKRSREEKGKRKRLYVLRERKKLKRNANTTKKF